MGEPLFGSVGPEVADGVEDLGGGVEAELGEGFATELDLHPGDITSGNMTVAPDLQPPVGSFVGDVEGLVVDAAGDGSTTTGSEIEATAALRLFVGATGVGPADVAFAVGGVEGKPWTST